jgi:hypothetical protein
MWEQLLLSLVALGRTGGWKASTASFVMNARTVKGIHHSHEAKILIEKWRQFYNNKRSQS